jgi:hypothetical protein
MVANDRPLSSLNSLGDKKRFGVVPSGMVLPVISFPAVSLHGPAPDARAVGRQSGREAEAASRLLPFAK